MIWFRGALILAAAWGVLRLGGLRGFLGCLFPLAWLSLSGTFRDACGMPDRAAWIWILVAFAIIAAVLRIRDEGRLILAVVLPLAALSLIFRSSLIMFLAFLVPGKKWRPRLFARDRGMGLLGVSIVPLGIFVATAAWRDPGFLAGGWLDLYDFVAARGFFSFLVLALLGMNARWKPFWAARGFLSSFLFLAGWILWAPTGSAASALHAAGVLFMLLAGFGLQTLRDEVMDDSWHGRFVWMLIGTLLAWLLAFPHSSAAV